MCTDNGKKRNKRKTYLTTKPQIEKEYTTGKKIYSSGVARSLEIKLKINYLFSIDVSTFVKTEIKLRKKDFFVGT